jgi:hypothetical protein
VYAQPSSLEIPLEAGVPGEQGLRAFIAKPPKGAAAPVLSRAYLLLGQVLDHEGKPADARSAFEQAQTAAAGRAPVASVTRGFGF